LLTRWLPDVLKMMRREEVEKCDTELRNRKNDLDEHPLLNVFTIETEILRRWNDYQEKQAEIRAGSAVTNKQYQDIVQIIRDIEGKLHKLKEKGGERYEQALRNALFPNLETLKKQAEERAHAEIALYPPEQGLDPLNYLRFRFRDVHSLDEGRIKRLRELLDFWTLITSLVEQTDTRRPIGEALLAGIVERQVNEVLPAWVTELVRQVQAFQAEMNDLKGEFRKYLQGSVDNLQREEQPEPVGELVRYEFYRLVVQQFAWLVERSTSQERMAIWADDLRFNTLCLALKELLEGKTRPNIPEELKQQLSVIKKSLPSTESKSYQSKSYQIDEEKVQRMA